MVSVNKNQNKPVLKDKKTLLKFYFLGGVLMMGIFMVLTIGFLIQYWFSYNTFKFQSPIVLRVPVWIERLETPEQKQMRALQDKIKEMEASEAARPKDAPIVNSLMKQSDASVVKNRKHSVILWLVYGLESTWGKQDICKANNKGFNGFGFMQPDSSIADGTYKCYPTFEAVTIAVDNWFDEKLKTMSLAEALCGYNRGFSSSKFQPCLEMDAAVPYLKNFVALANK